MDRRTEKAQNANRAASAIGEVMTQTITDLRPSLVATYDLDDQLVTLAIAKASVGVAADAASEAVGMASDECEELEERLHDVILMQSVSWKKQIVEKNKKSQCPMFADLSVKWLQTPPKHRR